MAAYEILQWDSEFFGFAVARIDPGIATPEELKRAAAELRARSVRLAYWLPQQNDRNTLLARQCGGTLIGGHARYESEISPPQAGAARALPVEPLPRGEVTPDLHALALGAGRLSRFARDPNMPPGTADRMYGIWIRRSLAGEIADAVLAARDTSARVAGLATVAREQDHGVIGLVSVAPEWQGRGIGRALMDAVGAHFARAGIARVRVATQTGNAAACALYEASGFRRTETALVAHFWL